MSTNAVTADEPAAALAHLQHRKGWLFKWTNYIKGYRKRWFVLQNGLLSYYRSQEEVSRRCRGTVNLLDADWSAEGARGLRLTHPGARVFHLRAADAAERDAWRSALQEARRDAVRLYADDYDDDADADADGVRGDDSGPQTPGELRNPGVDLPGSVRQLNEALAAVESCSRLLADRGTALQRALRAASERGADAPSPNAHLALADGTAKELGEICECAATFSAAADAMVKASQEYANLVLGQGRHWRRLVRGERAGRAVLHRMIERLARQHGALERRLQKLASDGSTTPAAIAIALSALTEDAKEARDGEEERDASSDRGSSGEETEEEEEDVFHDAQDTLAEACEAPIADQPFVAVMAAEKTRAASGGYKATIRRRDSEEGAASRSSEAMTSVDHSSWEEEDEEEEEGERQEELPETGEAPQPLPLLPHASGADDGRSTSGDGDGGGSWTAPQKAAAGACRQRRKTIPEKPSVSLNLWSIMKNCLGRDLSRIPMPVNFNEPLSFLQRFTEELEYAGCLDAAASCTDQWEQMAHVAAFMISAYSTTTSRVAKPFNPLLGETYECDRWHDLGWRAITEQVSHHPPSCSMFAEGCKGWTLWQEFTMSSKFRGKYLQIVPLGIAHLVFKKTGHHYTWHKVTTTVHNIIVGKLWVDNHGEVDFVNHVTGDRCHLKFSQYSYFSKDSQRKVVGVVRDKTGAARLVLRGSWDRRVDAARVLSSGAAADCDSNRSDDPEALETGKYWTMWRKRMPPAHLERCYNFSQLAVELNEPEEGVAPTDSRLRPDMRLMEDGRWDEANDEKVRLEEKQRAAARRRLDREAEEAASGAAAAGGGSGFTRTEYKPVWFKKSRDSITDTPIYTYTGQYWDHKKQQDWSICPHIY